MKIVNISSVTPVYAGREYIYELISKLEIIRNNWEESGSIVKLMEAIFVNDGSSDGSLELLYAIQKAKPWIRVINLSRNFGQHSATVAGILHSSGDWVVTIQYSPKY